MVGAEVDDDDVLRQGRRERGALAVREGQEDDVGLGELVRVGRREDAVGQLGQLRVHVRDGEPGAAAGRERPDGQLGVAEEQTEQFAAGVATRSCDCCGPTHVLIIHSPA